MSWRDPQAFHSPPSPPPHQHHALETQSHPSSGPAPTHVLSPLCHTSPHHLPGHPLKTLSDEVSIKPPLTAPTPQGQFIPAPPSPRAPPPLRPLHLSPVLPVTCHAPPIVVCMLPSLSNCVWELLERHLPRAFPNPRAHCSAWHGRVGHSPPAGTRHADSMDLRHDVTRRALQLCGLPPNPPTPVKPWEQQTNRGGGTDVLQHSPL